MEQPLSAPSVSQAYTQSDHLTRQTDRYALSKYILTTNWLRPHAQPDQVLYNIGCGNGQFNFMATQLGLKVRGFEPDADTFKIATELLKTTAELSAPQKARIQLFKSGLFEAAAICAKNPSEKADFLVMHDVLEHIEDDHAAVEQLTGILKPGGLGVISVPAMPSLFGFHDEQLGHFRRYTSRTLRAVLETQFEVESIRYFGASFIPVVYWFSVNQRKPYPHSQASSGLPSKILAGLCSLEEKIPLPLGTSVIATVRARK